MSEEELIETLKEFEKNRVEKLKEPSRNLFYAIMKIADERDKYKEILDKIKETMKEYEKTNVEDYARIIEFYNKIKILLEEIE